MPKLLFNLRGVPDGEADDLRALLSENNINYYETSPGNWGLSLPALWLKNESQLSTANLLIDQHQHQRIRSARSEYARLKAEGKIPGFLDNLKANALRVIFALAGAGALVYLPVKLFS